MRLQEKYKKEIVPALTKQFNYTNVFKVPKLSKVVVNVGVGRFNKDKAYIENVQASLAKITGQQPILNKARQSISAFKLREGMIVGVSVTLRGQRMYDFVEKLVAISLPRVRDFRGLNTKIIDSQGNLSLGFKENTPFPEIQVSEAEKIHGLEISIATTAQTKAEGLALFRLLGFPFKAE